MSTHVPTPRSRRAGVPVAAGAAVVLLVGGFAAVKAATGPERGGEPGAASTGAPSDSEWDAQATQSYVAWAGTDAEHQAAEVVAAHALNGDYSDCMSEAGYERPWQRTISPPPVFKDGLLYSFWGAGPLDGYYSQKLINAEIGRRADLAANSVNATGDEAQAELDCRADPRPEPSDDEVEGYRSPPVVLDLQAQWSHALAPALAAGGDLAEYDACVAQDGYLKENGARSATELREQLSADLPVATVPLGDEPSTPEWDAYLAKERSFVTVDWNCRKEARASISDDISQAVEEFDSANSDQITQARDHWDSMTAQAEDLGWSPGDPFAGAGLPSPEPSQR